MAKNVTVVPVEGGYAAECDGETVVGTVDSEAEAITAARMWLQTNGGGHLQVRDAQGNTRDDDGDISAGDPTDADS